MDVKFSLLTREQTSGFLDVCKPKRSGEAAQCTCDALCLEKFGGSYFVTSVTSLARLRSSPCRPAATLFTMYHIMTPSVTVTLVHLGGVRIWGCECADFHAVYDNT